MKMDLILHGRSEKNIMKKTICSLLMVFILIGCFTGTVEASARASGRFDITVAAGELKPAKTGFPLGVGETVTINASYYPFEADVDFGLVDKNGGFYYLEGENGSVSGSIKITVSGTYTFAVRNNSDVSVDVTGFVKY